jgi:hypothetical protein
LGIGDPVFAELRFANPISASKAIGCFPSGSDVVLDNGMLLLMTMTEAQHRFRHGIEWRSWGGELQPIDLIARCPDDLSRIALVWIEDTRLLEDVPRDILFARKMDYCARYVHDTAAHYFGNFSVDHPDLAEKKIAIEFVYAHAPTEKMRQTTEARPRRDSDRAIRSD